MLKAFFTSTKEAIEYTWLITPLLPQAIDYTTKGFDYIWKRMKILTWITKYGCNNPQISGDSLHLYSL